MRLTLNSPDTFSILAFGAHPDDIEFGCGGAIAVETQRGRQAHFVVCSKGEAASNGSPEERVKESTEAAGLLGATIEFVELDGDSHLETTTKHAISIAGIIRQKRPAIVLAPSTVPNQHPDHARLGELVRDAARLARYGGLKELKDLNEKPHAIDQLFYYAVTPDGECRDVTAVLIDIDDKALSAWTAAMSAHATQASTRNYIDLQLNRARVLGARAGIGHAIGLFPNDPMVFQSLEQAGRGARHF